MHLHHADMFDGLEFGARFAEYASKVGDAPRTPPQPQTKPEGRNTSDGMPASELKADKPDAPAQPEQKGRNTSDGLPVAEVEKATKARKQAEKQAQASADEVTKLVKDGVVTAGDHRKLGKQAHADAIAGVKEGLEGRIADHMPDDEEYRTNAWEQRIQDLTDSKGDQGLDVFNEKIKELKAADVSPSTLESLKAARDMRADTEQDVADVIKDKQALIGVLENEKATIEDDLPKGAATDFQGLRTQAQKWIDQLNANDGQIHSGSFAGFGDEWDTKTDVTFDDLVERFGEEGDERDELEKFASRQGMSDDAIDDAGGIDSYIDDLAAENPTDAAKVKLRYDAAEKLQGIIAQYNEGQDAVSDVEDQTADLDERIDDLGSSIDTDREALSEPTLRKLDAYLERGSDLSEASEDGAVGAIGSAVDAVSDGVRQGADRVTGADGGQGNGGGAGGNGNAGGGNDVTGGGPDQSNGQPAQQDVIAAARKEGLLPENTTFNKQGAAVYTVQPGDSYWSIAERSSGNKQLDTAYFAETVATNSERLGRDPKVGMLYADDQIVLPGRSYDDLVKIVDLPEQQQAEWTADELNVGF